MSRVLIVAGVVLGSLSLAGAQETPPPLPFFPDAHSHETIRIESAPIINRIPIPARQIRRVHREADGSLLVIEWESGTLFRVLSDGGLERLATSLNQPSDIAVDGLGNIYVSEYAAGLEGDGAIVRIDPMGRLERLHTDLDAPSALELDLLGNLIYAEYTSGQVVRLSPSGSRHVLATNLDAPSALAVDRSGAIYVTCSNAGFLLRIEADGTQTRLLENLKLPSDVQYDGGRLLVITNFGDGSLTAWDIADQRSTPFSAVPRGTIAMCFCEDGNFVLAHWEFNFLMKITRTLSLKCPHCGKPIPVHLTPATPRNSGDSEF